MVDMRSVASFVRASWLCRLLLILFISTLKALTSCSRAVSKSNTSSSLKPPARNSSPSFTASMVMVTSVSDFSLNWLLASRAVPLTSILALVSSASSLYVPCRSLPIFCDTVTPFGDTMVLPSNLMPVDSSPQAVMSSVLMLSKFALASAVSGVAEVIARMETSTFFLIITNVLILVYTFCLLSLLPNAARDRVVGCLRVMRAFVFCAQNYDECLFPWLCFSVLFVNSAVLFVNRARLVAAVGEFSPYVVIALRRASLCRSGCR